MKIEVPVLLKTYNTIADRIRGILSNTGDAMYPVDTIYIFKVYDIIEINYIPEPGLKIQIRSEYDQEINVTYSISSPIRLNVTRKILFEKAFEVFQILNEHYPK